MDETYEIRTLGGATRRVTRRVVGDTPEHGKHLLWDSHNNTITEVNGGLAFAVGVAALEAELSKDPHRFWQVQHPNGVVLYHIMNVPEHQSFAVVITKVGV